MNDYMRKAKVLVVGWARAPACSGPIANKKTRARYWCLNGDASSWWRSRLGDSDPTNGFEDGVFDIRQSSAMSAQDQIVKSSNPLTFADGCLCPNRMAVNLAVRS